MADIKEGEAFLGEPEEKVWVTSPYSKKKQVFIPPCLDGAINMSYTITGGLPALLCKRGVCSPVFLSGGNKMLSLHPLYLDRSTDKTLWLTRHSKPALEIQSLAGWGEEQ